MTLYDDFLLVYPGYKPLIRALLCIPLTARTLVIKACQAQEWPSGLRPSTLHTLISNHSDVTTFGHFGPISIRLINLIPLFGVDLSDPLTSAIVLDCCRGLPLPDHQVEEAKLSSWNKEISLAFGTPRRVSHLNWKVFFNPDYFHEVLEPGLPPNPNNARHIYNKLCVFRRKIAGRRFYPRASHKNMSRGTRREYESLIGSLDDVPVFGQDNWQYVYHHFGIRLGGPCELRQKWYPSGAKPRTYAASGGDAYGRSRFLQDFFTLLVNEFPSTNHITRLQPDRLVIDLGRFHGPVHFRIYDLSNFTSNMREQKFCLRELADFFIGVEVEIIDERDGPTLVDLGELLHEYLETCVDGPLLSIERFDPDNTTPFPHGTASLLGIFGNLMSCTFAHYLILTPVVPYEDEVNVAGDDGLVPEDELDNEPLHRAIGLVGSWALDKSFRGDEEAAICLKRPFVEHLPTCSTTYNLVPPTLAMASAYLSGKNDPRYQFFDLESMSVNERITVVGKDLLRFLRSAYRNNFDEIDRLTNVVWGFKRLVEKYTRVNVSANLKGPRSYTWPLFPTDYEFHDLPPMHALAIYRSPPCRTVPLLQVMVTDTRPFVSCGDTFRGNMTGRLKLLERFGYVEAIAEEVELEEAALTMYWFTILDPRRFIPAVYTFNILKDLPVAFSSWE